MTATYREATGKEAADRLYFALAERSYLSYAERQRLSVDQEPHTRDNEQVGISR